MHRPPLAVELKRPMVAILTFPASFGAIFTQQSNTLTHHSNKLVEKWHMMPSQVQRQRLWLVVDVDRILKLRKSEGVCAPTVPK
jgi:hypothetical protein